MWDAIDCKMTFVPTAELTPWTAKTGLDAKYVTQVTFFLKMQWIGYQIACWRNEKNNNAMLF